MIHAVHLCVCVNLNSVGFRKSYFPDLSMAEIKVAGFILLMISGYEFMGISCTFFFLQRVLLDGLFFFPKLCNKCYEALLFGFLILGFII